MKTYLVYCFECNNRYSHTWYKKPKFCGVCSSHKIGVYKVKETNNENQD